MTSTQDFYQKLNKQHLQPFFYPTTLETDELQEPPSLSSSPISQYSALYHTEAESYPAIAVPRSFGSIEQQPDGSGFGLNLGEHTQQMNTDDWNTAGLYRAKLSSGHHNRESSLSSLGSGGPTSPYPHNGITPRIAIADAGTDGLHGMVDYPHDAMWSEASYALDSKPAPIGHASDNFFPGVMGGQGHHGMSFAGASPVAQRQRGVGGLAPPIEFPNIRHGPDSVASSTIGGDSPSTPAMGEPLDDRRRTDVFREPPKFERSITDACQDSIYSNNMAIGTSSPSQHFSPSSQFTRAIEAANSQHLHVDQSPGGYRGSSPFRNGSPLAPGHGHDAPGAGHYHMTAAPQHGGSPTTAGPVGTPQTISPKDAMLELDDVDGDDHHYTFFHSQPAAGYVGEAQFMRDPTTAAAAVGHLQYVGANPGVDVRVQQPQYPFIPTPMNTDNINTRQILEAPRPTPRQEPGSVPKGADDGGTYSCTYHGCKLRFNTQKDLQTHKREGHRASGVARRGDRGENMQTQHGPHICNRINPSTNKICGSKFSRPYDLTRHEDTIHNANKKKLRCRICTEEKLFSRRDALNRHFKVCHEELYETEFPRRRRANRT